MIDQVVQYGASRAETAGYQLLIGGADLFQIGGYCNGANSFLQLFDSAIAPSANDVPVWCRQIFGNDGFDFSLDLKNERAFANGVYIALSTSEVNYVADTSGTKVSGDVRLFLKTSEGTTAVGDLTTNVQLLQVWAEAAGPKLLYDLYVKNATGAAMWAMIFATDANADGDVPLASIPLGTSSSIQHISFGSAGKLWLGAPTNSSANPGASKVGLTVRLSTTGKVLTGTTGNNRILAYYKAQ